MIQYFSTMRAATDKRSSPVERMDQVGNGRSLKQRLGPLKSRNIFYENPLVSGYCQFLNNSLKWVSALKNDSLKNIPTHTQRQALEIRSFCFSLMSKSSYEFFDKPPEVSFAAHRPVFERFKYLVTGPPNLQITQNQHVSTAKGYHGQVQSA